MSEKIEKLQRLAFLPGSFKCPKCSFGLQKQTLSMAHMAFGVSDKDRTDPELCPNGCGLLEPETERERRKEMEKLNDNYFDEIESLKSQLEAVRRDLPGIIYGLMAEYREPNWGSYEEKPVTDNAIKNTVELIRKLQTYPTYISPHSAGGVDLEFGGLSVCVMGDGYVNYAMLDADSGEIHINDNLDVLKSLIEPTQTSEEDNG